MSICQIYDLCAETLWLGRYGENGARDIAIDVGKWFADLGTEGTVVLVNWRPGEDDTPYNPNVTMDGSRVVWSPSNIDLAISGRGFAELRYYVRNALAKSKTFRTVIDRTPSEGANPPSAAEDWLERMEDAAVTAQTASETAVTAAETATEGAQAVAQALPTVTQAAQTATSAAATATTAATEAALSEEVASTAANAAQSASETATAASQTAVSASGTATTKAAQAVEAASTATTKASEATQAATTATANAQTSTAKAGEATTAAATATSKATEATTAAATASAAATTATSAASTATSEATAATAAKTAAETAQTGAETAQTAAEQAAEDISDSAAQIDQNTADITELKADLLQKANIDGAYSDLTAGNAEQLVSTVTNADDTPYNFRTTAGSVDVGDRAYVDAIVGGTLSVNQLFSPTRCQEALPYTHNGITYSLVDGDIVLNGTATANSVCVFYARIISGHKYLRKNLKSNGLNMFGTYPLDDVSVVSARSDNQYISISVPSGTTLNNYIYDGQIFDLTQMFGSTIADYTYSLETATAGAGVAWLKANAPKIFDGGYIPFNAGTLQSVVGLSEKRNTGLNQFDKAMMVDGCLIDDNTGEANPMSSSKATGYIPVLPGIAYYIKSDQSSGAWGAWYDAEKNYISGITAYYANATEQAKVKTAPDNAHYMRLTCVYNNSGDPDTFCVNLHWDGEKDGTYEPYTLHTYAFDPTVELRGVPKLKDGKMYFDGDRYLPDGTVQRRYGVVDLGTLNWAYSVPDTRFYTTDLANLKCDTTVTYVINALCKLYVPTAYNNVSGASSLDKVMGAVTSGGRTYLAIKDTSYADAATFKTAMSGVYLIYELAAPTTETATPYNPVEIVDDFGTEEFITTSLVPVGHETRYAPNLRAKLEMSPDSPDGDGDYIVRQANGENSYVSLASTTTIQDILARLTALEGGTT